MKIKILSSNNFRRKQLLMLGLTASLTLITLSSIAQDGNAGINDANIKVRSYFQSGSNLM